MARTRYGELVSSTLKLNLPAESVFAWPTSSMPDASLMSTTSSPDDGLPVVPFVTVPVKVAAEAKLVNVLASKTTRRAVRTLRDLIFNRLSLSINEIGRAHV